MLLKSTELATEDTEVLLRSTEVTTEGTEVILGSTKGYFSIGFYQFKKLKTCQMLEMVVLNYIVFLYITVIRTNIISSRALFMSQNVSIKCKKEFLM